MTTKHPPVLALENFLVRPEEPQVRPTSEFQRPPNTAKPKQGRPVPQPEQELISPVPPTTILAPTFRTSVYFHRAVHDVLRDIAHNERRSITDLINEGLDHVLAKRNYPGTADLHLTGRATLCLDRSRQLDLSVKTALLPEGVRIAGARRVSGVRPFSL